MDHGEGIADTRGRRADLRAGEALLTQVVEATRPKLVAPSHWHHAYELEHRGTAIKGFDCDSTDNAGLPCWA